MGGLRTNKKSLLPAASRFYAYIAYTRRQGLCVAFVAPGSLFSMLLLNRRYPGYMGLLLAYVATTPAPLSNTPLLPGSF